MNTAGSLHLSEVVECEAISLGPIGRGELDGAVGDAAQRDQVGPIGLALSGGGIRSATFALGVLQAFASRLRLASFDYLSTVSGGGYIGSWLSAWIQRAGLHEVQKALRQSAAVPSGVAPSSSEPPEVTWLRRYSNYLAPRVGLFSIDSLTLVATWLRNVGLNMIVLLSCLAAIFIAPLLLVEPAALWTRHSRAVGFGAAWIGLVFLFGIAFNLWHQSLPISRRRNWLVSLPGVLTTVVIPGLIAAGAGAIWLFQQKSTMDGLEFPIGYVAVLLLLLLAIWLLAESFKQGLSFALFKEVGIHLLAGFVALLVGAGALAAIHAAWQATVEGGSETLRLALLVCVGPPALLFAFGIASSVFTGLVGRVYFERSREWWSRLNAWYLTLGGIWLVLCLLAFFALPSLKWLTAHIGSWMALLGTGWIGSLFTAIFVHKPATASKRAQLRIDTVLNLAASVFVAGLLVVVAAGTSAALLASAGASPKEVTGSRETPGVTFDFHAAKDSIDYQLALDQRPDVTFNDVVTAHVEALSRLRVSDGLIGGTSAPLSALLMLSVVSLWFGWRVDVNKFSLHNMYKNRLVRCYLGASNQASRNEQPFTGLDDGDDFPLRKLAGDGRGEPVQRPYHIINTALNISQGSNLAWQERKAASFVFTPLYCGYSLARTQGDSTSMERPGDTGTPGYRPTDMYASKDGEEPGFTLGMALATSGAAVSPNMGHATQPALAFVLTLFNLRLGRWSSNPVGDKWLRPSPYFGLICLLQELLGHSNEERNFVYLSDGGHFENLGLYELVRRRCPVIFVVDAAADPERKFGDLAGAIRKCRIDLGVEISVENLELLRGDKSMRADRGFVEGTIKYDPADPAQDGRLVFIKPTLRRAQDEPPDVLNYAVTNPPFPQQSTADQFFDESQFESYRRLGLFIGLQCLDKYQGVLPVHPTTARSATAGTATETPTFATSWLARLFFKSAFKDRELPARDGSLVDFFVLSFLLVILFLVGFAAFDRIWLPRASGGVCLSFEICRANALSLMGAVDGNPRIWANPLFWRTMFDNAFIVVYTGMFCMGFVVAAGTLNEPAKRRPMWLAIAGLCAIAVLAAGVDYIENFLMLAALAGTMAPVEAAEQLAPVTALKFRLFLTCLVLLLLLVPLIVAKFRRRWKRNPR